MPLAKKVALNTIIQLVGRVITVFAALIIVIYLTRYLGVEGYGFYTTIIAYLGVFTVVADFGFYLIVAREIAKDPRRQTEIFNNTLTIRVVTAILLLVIANLVVFLMPYPEIVKKGILIFSLGIWAILLNQMVIVLFQIHLSTAKIALADVLGKVLILILTIMAIKHNLNLLVIMWISSAGYILTLLIGLAYAFRYVKIRLRFDFSFWKKIFLEAWPIGVVLALLSFYFRINTVFLSFIPLNHVLLSGLGGLSNAEATGLYGPAYRVLDTLIIFPAIFMGLVMPIFSRHVVINREKAKIIFKKSLDCWNRHGLYNAQSCAADYFGHWWS